MTLLFEPATKDSFLNMVRESDIVTGTWPTASGINARRTGAMRVDRGDGGKIVR